MASDSHHPLVFTFGILGNIISTMVYLAPVPTFYRIYKKKSTEGFHSVPYLVALFSSMLWLYYALVKKNAMLLITINSFGCSVEIIYITIFIVYATKDARKLTLKLFSFMNVGLFSLILIVSHFLVRSAYQIPVLGWINVAISVAVFAAPLSIVAQVIRTRSVEFMPFSLSFFLTLSAVMWFAYGVFLKDICVAIPNVLGFLLGVLQMLLYAIIAYRNRKQVKLEDDERKLPASADHTKIIVIITTTAATSEVHPVDASPLHPGVDARENEQTDGVDHIVELTTQPNIGSSSAV